MKTTNEIELNKKLALFTYAGAYHKFTHEQLFRNKTPEEYNFTESWDWLIPVYQHLKKLTLDLEPDSYIYIENCIEKKLSFTKMNTREFSAALGSIIESYYNEINYPLKDTVYD